MREFIGYFQENGFNFEIVREDKFSLEEIGGIKIAIEFPLENLRIVDINGNTHQIKPSD